MKMIIRSDVSIGVALSGGLDSSIIAILAKKYLAVPATRQFESERNFSMSGRTLESRRCSRSPENVDLLFIRKNHKI